MIVEDKSRKDVLSASATSCSTGLKKTISIVFFYVVKARFQDYKYYSAEKISYSSLRVVIENFVSVSRMMSFEKYLISLRKNDPRSESQQRRMKKKRENPKRTKFTNL